MTQYNTLNIKLSNSQLNKLKSRTKKGTEVTLKRSSNVAGDSNNENNFPHKLLLTNTQVNNGRPSYDAIFFDSFGVEHIPKEIKKITGNKNITTNIYRIQTYDSIMCGYFCIGFTDFMLKGKSLLD